MGYYFNIGVFALLLLNTIFCQDDQGRNSRYNQGGISTFNPQSSFGSSQASAYKSPSNMNYYQGFSPDTSRYGDQNSVNPFFYYSNNQGNGRNYYNQRNTPSAYNSGNQRDSSSDTSSGNNKDASLDNYYSPGSQNQRDAPLYFNNYQGNQKDALSNNYYSFENNKDSSIASSYGPASQMQRDTPLNYNNYPGNQRDSSSTNYYTPGNNKESSANYSPSNQVQRDASKNSNAGLNTNYNDWYNSPRNQNPNFDSNSRNYISNQDYSAGQFGLNQDDQNDKYGPIQRQFRNGNNYQQNSQYGPRNVNDDSYSRQLQDQSNQNGFYPAMMYNNPYSYQGYSQQQSNNQYPGYSQQQSSNQYPQQQSINQYPGYLQQQSNNQYPGYPQQQSNNQYSGYNGYQQMTYPPQRNQGVSSNNQVGSSSNQDSLSNSRQQSLDDAQTRNDLLSLFLLQPQRQNWDSPKTDSSTALPILSRDKDIDSNSNEEGSGDVDILLV